MKARLKNTLRRIHYSIPPEARKSYRFVVVLAEKIKTRILPVYQCYVRNDEKGETLSFVQIGWDLKLLYYWLDRYQGQYGDVRRIRWMTSGCVQKYLAKKQEKFDIGIISISGKRILCNENRGFLIPRWLELVLDIEQVTRKKKYHNIRRNNRKNALDFEIRRSAEDFDLFYYQMYTPFVSSRHGPQAEVSDYKHFATKFKNENAKLFFITRNNQPIAAAYVEEKGDISRLAAVGVLDGSLDIFRIGVVGALYYYVINHYREKGMKSLLMGKSMANVFDGVTEFKRQFGARPYGTDFEDQGTYCYVPLNETDTVIRFLKNNPVFYLQDHRLCIAGFLDLDDFAEKSEFLKHIKKYYSSQVDKTVIYCRKNIQRAERWIKEEGLEGIILKDVSEAFPAYS